MKSFFEGIASLFVDFLFVPMDLFRELELSNWWTANIINWLFIIVCCVFLKYFFFYINNKICFFYTNLGFKIYIKNK